MYPDPFDRLDSWYTFNEPIEDDTDIDFDYDEDREDYNDWSERASCERCFGTGLGWDSLSECAECNGYGYKWWL